MRYPVDNDQLALFIILSVGYAVYVFIRRGSATMSGALFLLGIGVVCLVIPLASACAMEGKWRSDFILAFLCFKKVSKQLWLHRLNYFLVLAYVCFLGGLLKFALSIFKRTDT